MVLEILIYFYIGKIKEIGGHGEIRTHNIKFLELTSLPIGLHDQNAGCLILAKTGA